MTWSRGNAFRGLVENDADDADADDADDDDNGNLNDLSRR